MADYSQLLGGLDGMINGSNKVMPLVASTALSILKDRIYGEGKDANDQKIGKYSTRATLVGRSTFITAGAANKIFGSKAKRRRLKWVNIGGKKLAVLEGGYKAIRQLEGRQVAFVDLRRSGTMENSHSFQLINNGFEIGFLNVFQGEKMKYNENRFSTEIAIFSNDELDTITRVYLDELARISDS